MTVVLFLRKVCCAKRCTFSPQRSAAWCLFILPVLILCVHGFCFAGWNARCSSKIKQTLKRVEKNNHMHFAVAQDSSERHSAVHPRGKKCTKKENGDCCQAILSGNSPKRRKKRYTKEHIVQNLHSSASQLFDSETFYLFLQGHSATTKLPHRKEGAKHCGCASLSSSVSFTKGLKGS